jgi:uncharacterized protein
LSAVTWVVALTTVFVGGTIQGTLGFGLGMIAAPVLALVDPRFVPGPLLVVGLGAAIWIAWRERASFEFGRIAWAVVGRVLGTLGGLGLLVVMSDDLVLGLLGLVTLAGVALSVGGWKIPPTRVTMVTAGAASGVMGLLTSIGGPPMALVLQHETGARMRSILSGFFVAGASMALAALALAGKVGAYELALSAGLFPALAAGLVASRVVARFLDAGWVRPAVLIVSGVSSSVLVITVGVDLMS